MAHVDPSAIAEAEQLVKDLKSHGGSATEQAQIVGRLDKLRCLVHTGMDALLYQFQVLPALNVLNTFGVFDAVPLGGSITHADLAAAVKLDASILRRFLRLVLTQGLFKEASPEVYEHTQASAMFRTDHAASLYHLCAMQFPNWWKVAEYLQTHSAAQARAATTVPYVWAAGQEGLTYWEALERDPAAAAAWHRGMAMIQATQPTTGMFPFASMQAQVEADPHRAFVVDVGGGRGAALAAIRAECGGGSFGAPMVLQDQAAVLEGADPVRIEGVQNLPHDFYEEQPIKNAHIYYLRFVLHDHYDERSLPILRHVAAAMGPTSRVLLGEMCLPASAPAGADPFPFFMDVNMFMEGGVERTEQQWEQLLGEAGLRIEKIWRLPDNPVQCTIEARLKA